MRPVSRRASPRPTAGSTASRCRAGSPSAPRSTALLDALGRGGPRASPRSHPASSSASPSSTTMQPQVGVPFTYTALLTMPTGTHKADARAQPARAGRTARRCGRRSRRGRCSSRCRWPSPSRSTSIRSSPTLMSTGLDERRAAYADAGVAAGHARGVGDRLAVRPSALGHLRFRRVRGASGARRPAAARRRRRARSRAVRRAARHRARRARPQPAGRLHPRQRRPDEVSTVLTEDGLHARAVGRRRSRRPALRRPAGDRLPRQLGTRSLADHPRRRRRAG